jgi:hypothetical protein
MAEINTEQMAQLLMGVARAQLAIIDSIENLKPGFRAAHLRPRLESASRIRSNHPLAMADFPSRLLLQMLGRNPPQAAQVALELEQLVADADGIPGRESPVSP